MPIQRTLTAARALARQRSSYAKINGCSPLRAHSSHAGARKSALGALLKVSEEVEDALKTNRPVVALESTIYTHGAMGIDIKLESIVRENGAVPAVIGVFNGVPTVGLTPAERDRMVDEGAAKVSRRDLSYLVGMVRTFSSNEPSFFFSPSTDVLAGDEC
jgi:pseudouridine-5'-phosphate glycosidase/pseudouridine kinase